MYKIIDSPYQEMSGRLYNSRLSAALDFTLHHDREQHRKVNSLGGKLTLHIILPLTLPFAVISHRYNLQFEKIEIKS